MKSLNKLQVGIILFSVLLFVLLYFANRTPDTKKVEPVAGKPPVNAGQDISTYINKKDAALSDSAKAVLASLKKQSDSNANNTALLDSIVSFWDRQMQPDAAAYYTEQIAKVTNTADAWIKAGERYYYSVRFVKDQSEMAALYKQAMFCFEKGLEKDPGNIEAKIKYASCYVEGTSDPMKGITLLKEVEKVDSNNINLQLAFAQFSTTSGQLDKAVMRLEKVIRLKPDYLEAYLYLADTYEQLGNKQKTIETLEKYAELVPDQGAKKEIKSYIDKLKSN